MFFALVSSSSKSKRYHLRCQPSMCYNVFACGDYFWCQPSLYFITFVQSISKRSPLIESWSSNQPPQLHRIWCFHQQKFWPKKVGHANFNTEKIMGWKRAHSHFLKSAFTLMSPWWSVVTTWSRLRPNKVRPVVWRLALVHIMHPSRLTRPFYPILFTSHHGLSFRNGNN